MVDFQIVNQQSGRTPVGLELILRHFHHLIKVRRGPFRPEARMALPSLEEIRGSSVTEGWLSVPGMFGGFMYRLDTLYDAPRLFVEGRIGIRLEQGPRYVITENGVTQIEDISALVEGQP